MYYSIVKNFNFVLLALFTLCYVYQALYVVLRMVKPLRYPQADKQHRYAAIVSARNESAVIGNLLLSIRAQSYPKELIDIYVVADNCTDDTAEVARNHGAIVFERFNQQAVGKGYALNFLFRRISARVGLDAYDAYVVFDADNVLDEHYFEEMNKTYDMGYDVVTSYRNSKNYGSNWISAGYALWFLRESKYLNGARMLAGTSCAISGTGFLVSSKIIRENGGWKHHLLTEDIEFSIDSAIHGRLIGYSEQAVLYDEQPTDFAVSWNQRLRWAKGFYQVFWHYGAKLVKGCFNKDTSFQCYDMLMTIAPATMLTLSSILFNFWFVVYGSTHYRPYLAHLATMEIGYCFFSIYMSLFLFGLLTTITEWKHIHCPAYKKILYLFSFPVFIFTYVPIAVVALFKKVTWTPIRHTLAKSVNEIRE